MGMYTGLRFKGVVKPEYRAAMVDIATSGDWENSNVKEFAEFGNRFERAIFIPRGALSYAPLAWYDDEYDTNYDVESGMWTFDCSLKNYGGEVEAFFELIPLFVESVEYLEKLYEEWNAGELYKLFNGKLFMCGHITYYWNSEEIVYIDWEGEKITNGN